ncbi:hypothetical protein TMatcc_005727 [Talaromyces marneffei ATCC 18224]|uniref:Nuclear speckle splicing regulatory protein 1 N-terminal domain-containing protein n=2 Tax=Talaromyces marneffei TaxID=37727 RepID=B6Q967_TALMQ|nr:uncharacterized protein EYB26_005757 [Talaromyces marneffei]EEA26021.1 conserved hypothetical protein [Talaromyces marneffei ATCC 18224]KAE8554739.1 hypothetical protein EYB25_003280 [Talaromyces marneffei]QGA18079.1 hypothetical protein EYB26_005757 [Talaromyces marneffei]
MPPKISLGINLSKPNKPTKPSPFGIQNKPLAAGQKRKKTVFGDSDSESERVEPQANNNKNGAIEITTLGGLGDEEENTKHGEFTPRKAARMTPQLGGAKPPLKAKSVKSSIFDDENDEGQQQQPPPEGGKTYGLQKPAAGGPGPEPEYKNLAALHTSRKHAQQAEEIDPSIYSYDAVYDTIKAKRESKKKPTNEEEEGSSKYMEALMRTAEIRKRDQMRARDRLLAKEREAEGDEFADKEKFVTAAYRAQQEEVKRMEEEEAKREKEEEERRRRNGDSGMMGFYKQMLARDEESHGEVMKATEEVARKVAAGEVVETEEQQEAKEKSEAQIAAELNARGANIIVNDEGQIVDKRQLLSAGLNVAPKPKAKPSDASARAAAAVRPGARPGGPASREAFASREALRARQTEMIAAQLEEKARQEEEAEKARLKELAEKNKSRKTETDVSSARERYLARKRERDAAQTKG